jgi:hypothetical protein
MWSSHCRQKGAAVSRADHPQVPGEQDVGSSIAAAFTRPHHSSSTPSGTLGDATTRWPAAYPPDSCRPGWMPMTAALGQQETFSSLRSGPTKPANASVAVSVTGNEPPHNGAIHGFEEVLAALITWRGRSTIARKLDSVPPRRLARHWDSWDQPLRFVRPYLWN